ncbi:MAG: DUF4190 domain-containing protein [Chloroflexi bacterium]|jgi:uncharacterized membrane protein|nr:DUF4190 domain-containing protein [Anaerolineaceae bacterium]NLI43928.1 DUF4190 domain-containing protein [Chloroflexota bacterium]HOE35194.1 DUF4190 domain-containing protein [Anaerolineaceae bacterium]HOT26122.1 DUF4190 domain-containing protein [Anaerolineaceae bacterium]HQH58338.1 DUF4190 domain-containing protein [Anaerolineaceae bacterium]
MTTNNPNQLPVTTSPWSIVSLISGISSYLVLPFLGGIIALITGYVARREIKSSNGALSGSGMATAGLWLGWINIILCVIVGILIILLIVGLIAGFSGLGPLSDWLNSFGY